MRNNQCALTRQMREGFLSKNKFKIAMNLVLVATSISFEKHCTLALSPALPAAISTVSLRIDWRGTSMMVWNSIINQSLIFGCLINSVSSTTIDSDASATQLALLSLARVEAALSRVDTLNIQSVSISIYLTPTTWDVVGQDSSSFLTTLRRPHSKHTVNLTVAS